MLPYVNDLRKSRRRARWDLDNVDDQFCSATGAFCEPQWVFGAWWLFLVVGGLVVLGYDRFRTRRLARLAADLGLAPNQRVVWLRGGSTAPSKWLGFIAIEIALVTVLVVGIGTRSVVIGVQATVVPFGACFGILLLLDLRWLLTLHPTPDDIEPLDPDQ
jgi:hypothetical protein